MLKSTGDDKMVIAMPQMGNDLFRKYMKSKYVKSLERAGAKVRFIELDDPEKAAQQALLCDGLLMPGGADVSPVLYGQEITDECGKPNEIRDKAEPLMIKEFAKSGKPIFGICRGIQIINVTYGGTLLQDIKSTQKEKHADFLNRSRFTHEVEIEKDSWLYRTVKSDRIKVNSMHHQAIDRVADGFVVTAKSTDGFIEAIEKRGGGFFAAVQWHPEHMSKKSSVEQALFDEFVKECKKVTC